MTKKYYIDSCIWRDYYENRSDRFRPLGEWALMFLNKIINDKNIILYSDLIIIELKEKFCMEEISRIMSIAGKRNLLKKVKARDSQIKEAQRLSRMRKVAFADAFHAITSRDNHATIITRDKHFEKLIDIVAIKKPEELI